MRLPAPFDPVVWDRGRFEVFWGWACRSRPHAGGQTCAWLLRAAAVVARRRGRVGKRFSTRSDGLSVETGYVAERAPRWSAYRTALEEEIGRMDLFLAPLGQTRRRQDRSPTAGRHL